MHLTPAFFESFWQALLDRQARGSLNKEDAVRYAFFHTLVTQSGIHQADIHLETQHLGLAGHKEIDLLVPPREPLAGLLAEFKFDRELTPRDGARRNVNRTSRVADVLKDLCRVSTYDQAGHWRRLFVYVTHDEMVNHFSRSAAFGTFFNHAQQLELQELLGRAQSASYTRVLGDLRGTGRVSLLHRTDQAGLHIRVFEVTH